MVDDGTITQALARHTVSEGDVFFIPAGRIHAIGKGCLLHGVCGKNGLQRKVSGLAAYAGHTVAVFSTNDGYPHACGSTRHRAGAVVIHRRFTTASLRHDIPVVIIAETSSHREEICLRT